MFVGGHHLRSGAPVSRSMHRELKAIDLSRRPKRHGGQAASPFRYPGGKGFLSPLLSDELARRFPNELPRFAEPYCGGAGAALNLLADGRVSQLHLNDADIRVYSAWYAIANETERFIQTLRTTEASIETWEKSLGLLHDVASSKYDFDVGFATFFVNRTSRSGVIMGSGPIGGYGQNGAWKISARYYVEALSKRIEKIGFLRDKIELSNLDGLDFCKSLQSRSLLDETFLFIDPPYVKAGGRLYYDGMTLSKHDLLAEWLQTDTVPHWLLTYDDHPLVRENYADLESFKIDVRYSLSRRRTESELMFMSHNG